MFSRKPTYAAFAWTFAFGFVAGAILGLIYAPVTGKKMQKKIGDVTEKVIDTMEEFGGKVKKMTA